MQDTKNEMLKATQRDGAFEATQGGLERCLRVRPASVDSIEALGVYLIKAVKSALSNANTEQEPRSEREGAAAVEEATLGRSVTASADVIHLDALRPQRRRSRAPRAVE